MGPLKYCFKRGDLFVGCPTFTGNDCSKIKPLPERNPPLRQGLTLVCGDVVVSAIKRIVTQPKRQTPDWGLGNAVECST